MPSQEEYLDQLLRNIMNGGKEQPPEEPVVRENELPAEEIYTDGAAGEAQWQTDMGQVLPEMPLDERMPGMYEGMSGETPNTGEMPVEADMGDLSAYMDGMSGVEDMSGVYEGMPGVEGMSGVYEEMPGVEGTPEMYGETPDTGEMPVEADMGDLSAYMDGMGGMQEMPVSPEEMSGMYEGMSGETPGAGEMPVEADMGDLSAFMEELQEMPVSPEEMSGETPDVGEMPVEADMGDLSAFMEELQGMTDGVQEAEAMSESREDMAEPSADDDIEDLFKTFEEELDVPMENEEAAEVQPEPVPEAPLSDFSDSLTSDLPNVMSEEEEEEAAAVEAPTTTDISSMSEDDIERLLAESSGAAESSSGSPEETFQGDVVDLLQGTEDGELQEIQDLLEKSDNNEAVDDQIEAILKEAVQENYQNSTGARRPEAGADQGEEAEEQLSPRQKKAMEKKRLKEEKAAAKKAAKEARKAEKAAKKAARKGGQNAEGAETADAAAGTEQSVDTAFLDSILSEAGKIDGAETISSATGNYDVKVDNIIPDEEDAPAAAAGSSAGADLGIDMDNLFGGSAEAESAMMADGDSDLAGFVALDGKEVDGVIELGGGDEEDEKPKKKGFFSRFLEFLTEEDEEEEEENEDIKLSEENQGIIEDLDKEKAQKDKKGKKGKKKAKKADESSEGGEEGEEGEEDKKGKKKKAKKPKKEKLPKEEEPVDPGKKLSLKKVLPVLLICLSIGAAILIMVYGSANYSDRKAARDAYYDGDYQTCYQNLYGKDLNESEQVMFGKSECILRIRMWIREYEILASEGKNLEALDSLIQSVDDYPALYDYAGQCNATGEVAQEYAIILNLLYENYGLTEDQARAIAAEPDDIEYTRQVNAIAQGGAYGSWNEPEPEVNAPLQDELPEETELPESNYIDTNTSAQ